MTRLIKQPKLWVMGSEHDLRRMAELVKYSGTFINRFPANDEIEAIDARRDRDLNARPRR